MEYLNHRRPAGGNLSRRSVRPRAVCFHLARSLIVGASTAFLLACATPGDSPPSPLEREDTVPVAPIERTEATAVGVGQTTGRPSADAGMGYHRPPSETPENPQTTLIEAPLSPRADEERPGGEELSAAEERPDFLHISDSTGDVSPGSQRGDELQVGLAAGTKVPFVLPPADPHISDSPRTVSPRNAGEKALEDALTGYHSRDRVSGSFTMPMLTPDPEWPAEEEVAEPGRTSEPDSTSGSTSAIEPDSTSGSKAASEPNPASGSKVASEPNPASGSQPGDGEPDTEGKATDEPVPEDLDPITHPIDSDPERDEYRVAVGESFHLTLPGDGWLFVGADSDGEVELVQRESTGEASDFEFEIGSAGEFDLSFQRQDASSGAVDWHTVRVLGSDDPFDRTPVPDRVPSPAARSVDRSSGIVDVEGVVDWDRMEGSISDGIEQPAKSREALVDEYRGLDDATLLTRLESAVDGAATERIDALLDALHERTLLPPSRLLLSAGDSLRAAGREEAASHAYRWWLSGYEGNTDTAGVHFALATLYEESATTADIRRSVEHYTTVAEQFPRSEHASAAESRARRLRRHFVEIR